MVGHNLIQMTENVNFLEYGGSNGVYMRHIFKYILKIKMTGFAGGLNTKMWSKCVKVDIHTVASSSGKSCLLSKP